MVSRLCIIARVSCLPIRSFFPRISKRSNRPHVRGGSSKRLVLRSFMGIQDRSRGAMRTLLHVSLQVSVCTCFLKARLSQDLVCRVVCGRLVEVTSGHPRPSLFGHRCTVGVVAGTHLCATESRVTLWQSANPCCVFVGVVTSCVPCARVRGRASRSCAPENTFTAGKQYLTVQTQANSTITCAQCPVDALGSMNTAVQPHAKCKQKCSHVTTSYRLGANHR